MSKGTLAKYKMFFVERLRNYLKSISLAMKCQLSQDSGHYWTHVTPNQNAKITGSVGKKCVVKCRLDDKGVEALWDTGAQVSENS